jgi:hypothetical protein
VMDKRPPEMTREILQGNISRLDYMRKKWNQ